MNKFWLTVSFTIALALTGCNGSSGENETITDGSGVTTATPTSIVLTVTDSNGAVKSSFNTDETITFTATLRDQNNNLLTNQRIDFTADLGDLSPAAKLTDSAGQAVVSLSNSDASIGAATVTASIGDVSAEQAYEFVRADNPQAQSTLTSQLILDGNAVNQFRADETASISAVLVNSSNQPIVNEIITFTAEVGTLSAPSALTNSQGLATVTLTGGESLGAGVLTVSYAAANLTSTTNYQILAADAVVVDPGLRIGSFDDNNSFTEGTIRLSLANGNLSAGGTLGLTVDLIDGQGNRVTTPTPVTFTSSCVANNNATVDETVNTINGRAQSTFVDTSCAGRNGVDDVIIASINNNGTIRQATANISISGEQIGAIEFVSAEPSVIVLRGTGGQGQQETSTLTFRVNSDSGNPLAQQPVDFTLSTNAGGIEVSPTQGLTNSQGLITTKVTAGTVPTAVRVNAVATLGDDTVQTQSDLLSINTGLPEQRSFTLSAALLNPEADSISGVTSEISVYLADNFNNPVPDGTTVNFTTEGGVIEPSCNTAGGSCTVTWTSSEPRVADHRVTILATAIGHESFFDTNGNNSFDDSDGSALDATDSSNAATFVASGFGRATPQVSGFLDMSEAWRDDNTNGVRDNGEVFIDFNNNNSFDGRDSQFNGPQCSGANCSSTRSIHVRKAIELVMASSAANYQLIANGIGVVASNDGTATVALPAIADGASQTFTLVFSDTEGNVMPRDTQVSLSASAGNLDGTTSFNVLNSSGSNGHQLTFVISNPVDGDPENGTITAEISSPSGVTTPVVFSYLLN